VDTADRLAAYLAGELDADERTALEGELGRDPVLRARLGALRRADDALSALRSPEPSPGFDARLRAALDPVLREVLEAPGSRSVAAEAGNPADELTARRAQRERRSWVPALVGVAAATAVLVGGGLVAGTLQQGGNDEASVAMDAMESLDGAEEDDERSMTLEAAPATTDGPTIVVSDRDLSADDADAVVGSAELGAVIDRQLDATSGTQFAASWRAALAPGAAMAADEPAPESDDVAGADAAPEVATADRQVLGNELTAEDEQAISRCLDELLAGAPDAIPVYVEVASFEGAPALVVGLVTIDPATGDYRRPEVWVLARSDCQVLRFSQG
jgi:anti-sigma factor RsiW